MLNKSLLSTLLILIALTLASCQSPFQKPIEQNPTPPMQEPTPGPSAVNPNNTPMQPGKFYRMGDPKQRYIALTFDDGPESKWTPRILDILRDKQIKATFFVIGRELEKYPDIAQRMVGEGHVIANHTYNHVNLNNVSPDQMASEINQGASAIAKFTGKKPKLLRPPFGAQNPKVVEIANNNGSFVILWSVDTEDWRGLDAQTIRARVVPIVKNGDIILQHNGEGPNLEGSVTVLPILIDEIKARGYTFVTIPEILNIPGFE